MTHSGRDWNELHLAEDPAVELLQTLGYTYLDPAEHEPARTSLKETILTDRLAGALKKINPWISDDNVSKAVKAITNVQSASRTEANERLYTTLTYGISLEQDRGEGKQSHTVHFIDLDNPENNEFQVTRQFKVLGTQGHIIPDLVVFVNGIPMAVIECKSPTIGDKWLSEGVGQLLRYQEATDEFRGLGAPQLFETVQVILASCGERAVYGTVNTPRRFFAEWKEPYPLTVAELGDQLGREPTGQDIAIYGLFEPRNLLDLVRNFVVFDTDSGKTIRKVARYKQFMAVNKAVERIRTAKKPTERGGVVWHTQGSGKSLTMLWLALKLRRDPAHENPTIVLVTDRKALDRQISGTFVKCGFPNPEAADSVRHLRELLSQATGKTVMTTVQKFMDLGDTVPVLSEAENIFVMVDEAHRTQYKSLAANMRQALPNACFLGFTGTPIDKQDRSTLQTFGPYIDTYTIEQAVADGATVPIFYESRLPELRVVGRTLDQLFDHVFADRSEEEREAIKARYATERSLAEAPKRIETLCLDLLEHYRQYIQPNGFKAQIVTVSRDAAVTYQETLQRLNGPESALIMSGSHNDPKRLAKWRLEKPQQDALVDRFKDPKDSLSILVVCDMLITGFDAPVEQVMYLDSPLKEHSLLQAIARVNRRADKKDYGLVVDYWGVSTELQDALAVFSSGDIEGALRPKLEDELPRLQSRHRAVLRFFDKVDRKDLNACVKVLEPEDTRTEFDVAFRRFSQSMDMLLPDPRALPYNKDLTWLGKVRQTARARYHDPRLDISDAGAKVRKLIEDAVIADGVQILVKEVSILSPDFEKKLEALTSDEAKASEMEHAIRHEITVKLEENPAFYTSLRERLEAIIEEYRHRRLEMAEQLDMLKSLMTDIRSEGAAAEDLGLSRMAHAIYGVLDETVTDGSAKDLAERVESALEPYVDLVDWAGKEDLQRRLRRDVKRVLRDSGLSEDEVNRTALSIADLAKARKGK